MKKTILAFSWIFTSLLCASSREPYIFDIVEKNRELRTYFLSLNQIDPLFDLPKDPNDHDIVEFFWHLKNFNQPIFAHKVFSNNMIQRYIDEEKLDDKVTVQYINTQKLQNEFPNKGYSSIIHMIKNRKLFIYNNIIKDSFYIYDENLNSYHFFKNINFCKDIKLESEHNNYPINSFDQFRNSILVAAIENNYPELVKNRVDLGSNINTMHDYDKTPLSTAIDNFSIEMVSLLLNNGADPNFKSGYRYGVFEIAVDRNFKEIVKLLSEAGANLDSQDKDSNGNTLLMAYIDSIFHTNKKDTKKNIVKAIKLLIDNGANLDLQNDEGLTALMLAARMGYKKIVTLLLKSGASANPHIRDKANHNISTWAHLGGNSDIIEIIGNEILSFISGK